MEKSLLLQGGTVVGSQWETKDDVLVRAGVVEEVDRFVEEYDSIENVSGKLLMPALIDCHVHFREPGLEHKATMKTESEAALAGGVTTVCEMPNTIPPTVTVAALADKVRRAAEIKGVDIRFFFGITQDIHLATFLELMNSTSAEAKHLRSRLAGIKIYLDHSTGNQKVADELLDDIFEACARHKTVLVAHCEDPEINAKAGAQNTRTFVAVHSLLRPADSEVAAIEKALKLAKKHGTQFHVAHLSTEGGIDLVRDAKREGINVTCEVAPHHLIFTTDHYERLGTLIKMNPPVRSYKHRAALWQGIIDGTVDCISTDHAPHTLEEKKAKVDLEAPSGVPGVETMLPILLSIAGGKWPDPFEQWASCPPFHYKDIVRLCVKNPSRIFGLDKHEIEEDKKVEILVIDPNAEWTIKASEMHSKCNWTPYEGWTVKGKLERIIR
jgi:dihydroorotase